MTASVSSNSCAHYDPNPFFMIQTARICTIKLVRAWGAPVQRAAAGDLFQAYILHTQAKEARYIHICKDHGCHRYPVVANPKTHDRFQSQILLPFRRRVLALIFRRILEENSFRRKLGISSRWLNDLDSESPQGRCRSNGAESLNYFPLRRESSNPTRNMRSK